jgi:membrane protease YdiL (CAAX protease family)
MSWEATPWLVSLAVLVVWMVIVLGGEILQARRATSLQALVSRYLVYALVVALIFLLAVVAAAGWWREVGLQLEGSLNNLTLLAVPGLALIVIWAFAFSRGLPPGRTLLVVGANTLLVGFSEELMFRGILFHGSQSAFGVRWAVVITAAIFGLSHALNGLITGKPKEAAMQAFLGILFGFWTAALRVHLDTLIPLIVVHWLWDFGLFAAASAKTASSKAASIKNLLPFACAIVLFAYGLWLFLA